MGRIADSAGTKASQSHNGAVESRVFRAMIVVVAITVVGSLITAPLRVSTGLILGGALSLLNFHWLSTSMMAIFSRPTPRIGVIRYILRYILMATVIAIGYKLRVVSLPATFAGLGSFVVAFFIEASRQSYFILIGREESF